MIPAEAAALPTILLHGVALPPVSRLEPGVGADPLTLTWLLWDAEPRVALDFPSLLADALGVMLSMSLGGERLTRAVTIVNWHIDRYADMGYEIQTVQLQPAELLERASSTWDASARGSHCKESREVV
jgi:hypothetical protein